MLNENLTGLSYFVADNPLFVCIFTFNFRVHMMELSIKMWMDGGLFKQQDKLCYLYQILCSDCEHALKYDLIDIANYQYRNVFIFCVVLYVHIYVFIYLYCMFINMYILRASWKIS